MTNLFRWKDGQLPPVSVLPGMTRQLLRLPDEEFPFLHDTAVISHGGRLFAAWYCCTEGEIAGHTEIRGRWIDGDSLSPEETVLRDDEYHCVPAAFYEEAGELHALVTRMTAHDRPVDFAELVHTENGWKLSRRHPHRFLFNTAPFLLPLPDGTVIAGGRMSGKPGELPQIPTCARKKKGSEEWETVPLTSPDCPFLYCPETALLIGNRRIDALIRSEDGHDPVFSSSDGGKSWEFGGFADLPLHGAKTYGLTLPDGRQLLFANERTPSNDRSRLMMYLRNGEDEPFCRRFLLAEGTDEELRAGPFWHYPCACLHGGGLTVTCTANGEDNRRSAAMFRIPLTALEGSGR